MRSSVNIVAAVLLAGCTSPERPALTECAGGLLDPGRGTRWRHGGPGAGDRRRGPGLPEPGDRGRLRGDEGAGQSRPGAVPGRRVRGGAAVRGGRAGRRSGDRAAGRDALAGADRGGGRHGLRHLAGLRRPGGLAVRTAGRAGGGHRAGPGDPCRRLCLSRHAGHDRGQRRQARHLQCGQLRARRRILPAARPLCQPERRRQLAAGQLGGVAGRFLRAGGTAPEPGALGARRGAITSCAAGRGRAGSTSSTHTPSCSTASCAARSSGRTAPPCPISSCRRPIGWTWASWIFWSWTPPTPATSIRTSPTATPRNSPSWQGQPRASLPGWSATARSGAWTGWIRAPSRPATSPCSRRCATILTRPCRKAWSWCCPAISIASRR